MLNQDEQAVIQNVIIKANQEETLAAAVTQGQQQAQTQAQPQHPQSPSLPHPPNGGA